MSKDKEESLDPDDWNEVRALAHRMVDDAVRHMAELRERPVWQEIGADAAAALSTGLPQEPTLLGQVYDELLAHVRPYPMGNIHPRFWGWYMGASNFTGALGDFLAGVDGSNLGGGATAATKVEEQVIDWLKEMVGMPADASGTLTSGGSMANMVGLTVARNALAGVDVRQEGVAGLPAPLCFYASDQAHSCLQKALEVLGLGAKSLRRIPSDADLRIDLPALEAAIAADRAAGMRPACVIGTAGATNTGAIDDLQALAAICKREGLWFHIDGCIGAFLKLAPLHRHLVAGVEQADSLALDPHKWLHAPFDAGCVLVRNSALHHATFEMHGEYLQLQERGLLAGKFLADYGIELSRGFKALKIWMALKEHGSAKFGRLIDQNIAQAAYFAELVQEAAILELTAPHPINIVCFRFCARSGSPDAVAKLNTEVMLRLQEAGTAVLSDTMVGGDHCLRIAINNHRTRREDLDLVVRELLRYGRDIAPFFQVTF